jgi:hypothetical protein
MGQPGSPAIRFIRRTQGNPARPPFRKGFPAANLIASGHEKTLHQFREAGLFLAGQLLPEDQRLPAQAQMNPLDVHAHKIAFVGHSSSDRAGATGKDENTRGGIGRTSHRTIKTRKILFLLLGEKARLRAGVTTQNKLIGLKLKPSPSPVSSPPGEDFHLPSGFGNTRNGIGPTRYQTIKTRETLSLLLGEKARMRAGVTAQNKIPESF